MSIYAGGVYNSTKYGSDHYLSPNFQSIFAWHMTTENKNHIPQSSLYLGVSMQPSFGQGNIKSKCCVVLYFLKNLTGEKAHPFLLHPIAWNVDVMNDE